MIDKTPKSPAPAPDAGCSQWLGDPIHQRVGPPVTGHTDFEPLRYLKFELSKLSSTMVAIKVEDSKIRRASLFAEALEKQLEKVIKVAFD